MGSKFQLTYGPRFNLNTITRAVPAPVLAEIFEVIGFLLENPFPGRCAVDVTVYDDEYYAALSGGVLVYEVKGRTIILTSVVLV